MCDRRGPRTIRPDQGNTDIELIIAHVALRDHESVRRNVTTALNLVTAYRSQSRSVTRSVNFVCFGHTRLGSFSAASGFTPRGMFVCPRVMAVPRGEKGRHFELVGVLTGICAKSARTRAETVAGRRKRFSASAVGLCDHTREMARSLFWQCFVLQHSFVRLASTAMASYNSDTRQRTRLLRLQRAPLIGPSKKN